MERALIIRQPWLELILSGKKTAEMRTSYTKIRGAIGLIEQGSGLILGQCELYDSTKPMHWDELMEYHWFYRHRIESESLLKTWNCAWLLRNVSRYIIPVPYDHPQGAVKWVKFND